MNIGFRCLVLRLRATGFRRSAAGVRLWIVGVATCGWLAGPAFAQTSGGPAAERPPMSATLDADLIAHLPTGDSLFHLLDATQPTLVADRFFGGGLYVAQPGRIGGFLGSWSQTLFRVGDIDLTDPTGRGAPLLSPDPFLWNAVRVTTGMLGADERATGLSISLEPRRPSPSWTRTVQATTSHFGSTAAEGPPAIARIDGWDRVTGVASGPLITDRLGLVFAGSWTRGSQFERAETTPVSATVASGFAHLVFTPTTQDEIRTIGWIERASAPFDLRVPFAQPDAVTTDTAVHMQSTWERRDPNALPWRVFAGYSRRVRTPGIDRRATIPVFERLRDGPMSRLASMADETVHQWSLGARARAPTASATGTRQTFEAGVDVHGAGARSSSFFSGVAGELVNGLPARVWRFAKFGDESFRHELGWGAYVNDRIAISPRLTIDGAVRYDSTSGSARGASEAINWRSILPRAALRWTIAERWAPALVAGFSRSAYRLPLDLLAFGDPVAPSADIFRWNAFSGTPATVTTVGPLVARAGPGTNGDPSFVRIDAELKRPQSDEVVAGVEVAPAPDVRVSLIGVARRERDFTSLLNAGSPEYGVSTVFDPGADRGAVEDDRFVPVYNRLVESFGYDRYLLTTGLQSAATFNGVELAAEMSRPRFVLLLGATAGRAVASAANRGIGPLENDQGLVGELTADPNAATFARGRPFTDRAYTAKVTAVYRLPRATTIGVIARYQDGQPFARMLIFPGLNQGAEAVRAFANGDSRFMFTGTLDARLTKGFTIGGRSIAVVVDAYNLLGLSNSVEESTAAPPDVRITTAVQPPLTLHVGLRVTF